MLASHQAALADPEMLALSEELAVIAAREVDLIARVDTGEAGTHWLRMRHALTDFRKATHRQVTAGAAATLREMERLVNVGAADYRAWAELLTTIETRRRLVDSERLRLEAPQQMMTTDRAMQLVAALVDAVRWHVDDRKVLEAIGREAERLVATSSARCSQQT